MKQKLFFLIMLFWSILSFGQQFTSGGINYNTTSTTTVEVTQNFPSYSGNITIPSSVSDGTTNYSVTSIGYDAFSYCSGLTSVTIPNSVTSIGNNESEILKKGSEYFKLT